MIEFSCVIFMVFILYLCIKVDGVDFKPIVIVLSWWVFWVALSALQVTGLDKPSSMFYIIPCILIVGVYCGYWVGYHGSAGKPGAGVVSNERIAWGYYAMSAVVLVLMSGAFKKSLDMQGMYGDDLASFRSDALGSTSSNSIIFNSVVEQLIYLLIITPFVSFAIFYGIVRFVRCRDVLAVLVGVSLVAVDSIINFGRTGIYQAVLVFIFASYVCGVVGNKIIRKRSITLIDFVVVLSVVAGAIFLTYIRLGDGVILLSVLEHLFDYHMIGFLLFDKELVNPNSFVNSNQYYGLASVGAIEEYFSIAYRLLLDSAHISTKQIIGSHLNDYILSGVSHEGRYLYYNAYYTVLYSLYIDLRYFGVVLGGAIYGFALGGNYKSWVQYGNEAALLRILLLMFLGYFSIFASPLEGQRFWIPFLMTYILEYLTKRRSV